MNYVDSKKQFTWRKKIITTYKLLQETRHANVIFALKHLATQVINRGMVASTREKTVKYAEKHLAKLIT